MTIYYFLFNKVYTYLPITEDKTDRQFDWVGLGKFRT